MDCFDMEISNEKYKPKDLEKFIRWGRMPVACADGEITYHKGQITGNDENYGFGWFLGFP